MSEPTRSLLLASPTTLRNARSRSPSASTPMGNCLTTRLHSKRTLSRSCSTMSAVPRAAVGRAAAAAAARMVRTVPICSAHRTGLGRLGRAPPEKLEREVAAPQAREPEEPSRREDLEREARTPPAARPRRAARPPRAAPAQQAVPAQGEEWELEVREPEEPPRRQDLEPAAPPRQAARHQAVPQSPAGRPETEARPAARISTKMRFRIAAKH